MKNIIKKILREETGRKNIFEDEINGAQVRVSSDGIINIFDVVDKLVYRYQIIANIGKVQQRTLKVVSLDLNTGDIKVQDPTDKEIYSEVIDKSTITNILKNYRNKEDFKSINSFREKGFNITIDLDFYGTQPLKFT